MKFKSFNIKKAFNISCSSLLSSPPSPIQTQSFFLWEFSCLLTVLWMLLKSVLEEGREGFMVDRTGFQELYLFIWKLTKPAESKCESGSSVCCGLVAEDCHTRCTESPWNLSELEQFQQSVRCTNHLSLIVNVCSFAFSYSLWAFAKHLIKN